MSLWRDGMRKDWRFEFQFRGRRHTGAGFETKGAARDAMEAMRKQVRSLSTQAGMGFKEVANLYLDMSERRHARKTYQFKKMVFKKFVKSQGDMAIDRVTPHVLHGYLNRRPTNANYNAHRKDLCTLFEFARRQLKIQMPNPCWDLPKMPVESSVKEIPTEDDILKLILAAGPDERPLVLFLLHTLARVGEALRCRWRDVNFEQRTITLWTRKRKDGSMEADRLPMNDDLYAVLWRLWKDREQDEWVFWNAKTQAPFNRRPKFMAGLCKRAKVRVFGFHAIRHFVATYLADSLKVSKATVSGLLRHHALGTTEIYLHSVDASQRDAVKGLEGRFLVSQIAKPQTETQTPETWDEVSAGRGERI